uniref:Uncharacterized protein n=1 Tax=viral metagenome TaxID=1070528 RepID=A0A6M3LQF8_9ZZZZ
MYYVYAKYSHEQSDWLLSKHRCLHRAAMAADKWTHYNQCDGGNLLAHVYEDAPDCPYHGDQQECRDKDGKHLHSVDFFDTHNIIVQPMGLGYKSKF